MSSDTSTTPAGWYPDSTGSPGDLRYWDGRAWTAQTQAGTPHTQQAVARGRRPVGPGFAGLGTAVTILLGLCAAVLVASFAVHLYGVVLISGWVNDPAAVDPAAATDYDHLDQAVVLAYLLALLVTGITFIVWFRRAYLSDRVDAGQLHDKPAWTVWAWFVPWVALFKPGRMMGDLLLASRPAGATVAAAPVKQGKRRVLPRVVRVWWALWLLGGLVSTQAARSGADVSSAEQLRTSVLLDLASDALLLGAAVLAIGIVRRITRQVVAAPPRA